MVVKNNLSALNTNNARKAVETAKAKSTEKLSSGYKINRGADNASGLAISEKMRRQIWSLAKATENAQDGISSLQTADGALNQVSDMLTRMSELAIKAGNETLGADDRRKIESEMNALKGEIDRVSNTTTFNEQKLLDGTFSESKKILVGADATEEERIDITIAKMDWDSISEGGSVSLETEADIAAALDSIKVASRNVATMRSDMGATQNRLESTVGNLKNVVENTTAAESKIRDTDMAEEMIRLSTLRLLSQAGNAMQAQANQQNQRVLALLLQ